MNEKVASPKPQPSPRDGESQWTCDVCEKPFEKGKPFNMDFHQQLWWCTTCISPCEPWRKAKKQRSTTKKRS